MGQEASGSTCSVAMWPALPQEAALGAPAVSITVTRKPAWHSRSAALRPIMPPPMTITRFAKVQPPLAFDR
jgi:hypothetical protein